MRREKGSGSIYKRDGSPLWWIKYHRHGRPFRESTRTTDWSKAGKMLKTWLSEINQGTFMGPQTGTNEGGRTGGDVRAGLPH